MSTTKSIIDALLASAEIPPRTFKIEFNPEKHFLGSLCARRHDYDGTGRSVRGIPHNNCMICMRLNALAWKRKYPERVKELELRERAKPGYRKRRRLDHAAWRARNPLAQLFYNTGARAKALGVPFDLTNDGMLELWERQGGRCHWLGVEIQPHGPDRHPLKPSIDRLIPERGYVFGNVVWVTNFANRARSDTPAEEFRSILEKLGLSTAC